MDEIERCIPCPPLGAQKQGHNEEGRNANDDNEEQEHFHQICRSYQQYATFHQTRQQGVNHRVHQMLNEEGQQQQQQKQQQQQQQHPTIESIMPPSLLPQTLENQRYQKQFCDGTIRNQFFLDNVLKYSGVMTSQEVLRQRREEQQISRSSGLSSINSTMLLTDWATEDQMSKIDSVLKSVARDWSREGREERSVVYDRLVGALARYMPLAEGEPCCSGGTCCDENTVDNELRRSSPSPPRVAVPGSGLGRLAWEIYSKGYSVQGSDFSLPMLLASDFMLNGCGIPNTNSTAVVAEEEGSGSAAAFKQFAISPWISETKNTTSFRHRMRTVVVPDVDPTSLQHEDIGNDGAAAAPEFTMMAGEFLSLYSHFLPDHSKNAPPSDKKFHAVVCSFFLDTAPSLPHYLLTLYHMLEEGGLLLHFGPLMYHWSGHGGFLPGEKQQDARTNNNSGSSRPPYINTAHQRRNKHLDQRYLSSIDYTWEEFRYMVLQCGFEILEEEMYIPARYTGDEKGMMKVVYDCAFLVARKKKSLDG